MVALDLANPHKPISLFQQHQVHHHDDPIIN